VVEQYNSLLETAKEIYPKRVDIQGLQKFTASRVTKEELDDAVERLTAALTLVPPKAKKQKKIVSKSKFGIPDLESFKMEISKYSNEDLGSRQHTKP
jgi:hypothetical protein